MQITNSVETTQKSSESPSKQKLPLEANKTDNENIGCVNDDGDSVIDVSGKTVDFPLIEGNGIKSEDNSVEGLYLYKNILNLLPKSVGRFEKLRNLKFFGNEINLFPSEVGNLLRLECLQIKIPSPGVNGFALNKLEGLKELELSKVPSRPSVLTLLSEIAGLKCLTKLSVCHFSIRYLPPEIGCLNNLEQLDLSFNKMKYLPTEICYLKSLISLKVANNKLVELPPGLSSLQRLENLDLSNNRLMSLGSLELGLMHNLQNLNLQYNKLLSYCQMPSWICCNLEGNGKDSSNDDFISSSTEMDIYEALMQENGNVSFNESGAASHHAPSGISTVSSSNSRSLTSRESSKQWKRDHLQQRARQERLNNSRKWKGEGHAQTSTGKGGQHYKASNLDAIASETPAEEASDIIGLDDDDKKSLSAEAESGNLLISIEDKIRSTTGLCVENCSCAGLESIGKEGNDECSKHDAFSISIPNGAGEQDEGSSSEKSKAACKTKRHSDRDLDNPKPCKSRKSMGDSSNISLKYSSVSFCSIEDRLPDGFYDAGRDRPFMQLTGYEQTLHLDSREVILVDRKSDEELDAIALSAQALVRNLKQLNGLSKDGVNKPIDNLHIASLLALFVSDHFGGSDRSAIVERTRKFVSGSNYRKPFVCTCSTGNSNSGNTSTKQVVDAVEDIVLSDLCEKSLCSIKSKRNSVVVPIGSLQFGVCRHRAVLLKYLCDRVKPPVPCELVRGYLDFQPHAWNTILVKQGDSWIRMIVDACRPLDIREEADPEYFIRYIPLSRTIAALSTECDPSSCSVPNPGYFPSLGSCDEVGKSVSSYLFQCKFGSVDAAVKVRTLEVCGSSADEIRKFEYSCLGEVRILGALRHSCIVKMYGHKISSKWVPSVDGNPEHRLLQSAIFMEYVKGGSVKNYIEKLSKAGEKHVPLELALFIAQDVAAGLSELHSKHIMHRDIKSENILIDLEMTKADGKAIVKLCDFDRAVPLWSSMHTCCIAHRGIPPPDVCVGTPRWMAPEVLRAMHKPNLYGLEVDIWSFGCLLLELLTLQVPYTGLSELEIHDLIQMGKRPRLTDELEALGPCHEHEVSDSATEFEKPEAELETLSFLVDLFRHCTEENPTERPTAGDLYESTSSFICSRS